MCRVVFARFNTRAHTGYKLHRRRLKMMNKCPSNAHNLPDRQRSRLDALVSRPGKEHVISFQSTSSSSSMTTIPLTPPPATRKRPYSDENTPPEASRTLVTPEDKGLPRATFPAWENLPADDALMSTEHDRDLPAMLTDEKVRPQHMCVHAQLRVDSSTGCGTRFPCRPFRPESYSSLYTLERVSLLQTTRCTGCMKPLFKARGVKYIEK